MFEFAMPWAFFLLFFPVLIWTLWPKLPSKQSVAVYVPFLEAILGVIEEQPRVHSRLHFWVWPVIWGLAVVALAGPRYLGPPLPLSQEGYNIMMVLDISGSMALEDMPLSTQVSSRLDIVKQAAAEFVQSRSFDKIGLILFATRPYLLTPLTFDKQTIIARLMDATVGLAGQSTAVGDALGLAVKRLMTTQAHGRVMIILTDGASNTGVIAPLQAAQLAKEAGIKIYTIGLGGESHQLNSMAMGLMGPMDLDEETLMAIAKVTHGQYFRATDATSLQTIYSKISRLAPVKQEKIILRPKYEYYPWILALAFFLFMAWLISLSQQKRE